jgi:hypothetical protein
MTAIRALIWRLRFAALMRRHGCPIGDAWIWATEALKQYGIDKLPRDAVASELNRW